MKSKKENSVILSFQLIFLRVYQMIYSRQSIHLQSSVLYCTQCSTIVFDQLFPTFKEWEIRLKVTKTPTKYNCLIFTNYCHDYKKLTFQFVCDLLCLFL